MSFFKNVFDVEFYEHVQQLFFQHVQQLLVWVKFSQKSKLN
jgi:hypothetical protein